MVYKLRSTLVGHEADVRGVASTIYPIEGIVTVSRDQSCRVWAPKPDSIDFKEEYIFYGHTKYVSSVCVMPPSEKHPNGLIATGGNDNLILIHEFESGDPVYTLTGHSAAVSALDAGNFGTVLSGSWDKTAKVWVNGKEVLNLAGHEAAVWAVKMLPDKGLMLTGSADKTIKLWKAGKCERTYIGHIDCVRGLAVLPSAELLSCSNDGTIRKWLLSGECLQVFEGHTNYVYSIAIIPGTSCFISSGEDRTVRVWNDGKCEQTITLPSQSIWSVGALENGDIFAGSSDFLCRVFSKDPNRQAGPELQKEFEETVANQAIPAAANLDLGDIKVNQLPGPESLLQPGVKADQTKLIKNNGVVEAYQWDVNAKEWKKIGEVTGAAGEEGSKRTSGKTTYQGKEYDFVFDVDIKEGSPPLKLPFNVTEDPWVAAHNFLQKNDISPMFLDEVANFIIKNTEGITLGQGNPQFQDPYTGAGRYVPGSASSSSTGGSDPFTGAGRYVPGSSSNTSFSTGGSDPFTGAGRYVPPQSSGHNASSQNGGFTPFPEKNFLNFSTGKYQQITSKIREFNSEIEQNQLTEKQLEVLSDSLNNLLKGATQLHKEVYDTLSYVVTQFSQWPHDKLVPVLDSIRVLVLNDIFCSQIFSDTNGVTFIDNLVLIARNSNSIPNSMLVFRIFTNAFVYGKASFVMHQKRETILECCLQLYEKHQHKNLRIALSSYLVNTCIYCRNISSSFEDSIQLCTLLHKFLSIQSESEAVFRLLVALGTLIFEKNDLIAFTQSFELPTVVKEIGEKANEQKNVFKCPEVISNAFGQRIQQQKVKDCSTQLMVLLQ